MGSGKQERLCLYGKGICMTKSGHLRYRSPKELRGKYVHRVVVEKLLEETAYSIRQLIPFPYEVHHADYNKTNNAPENLILLDVRFHAYLTADRPRGIAGRFDGKRVMFRPRWTQPVQTELDEVPF